MYLYIYQPQDWLKITKLLGITVIDLVKELNISPRNFYQSIERNNTNLETVINFTNIINDLSAYHENEYNLPPKIRIINPKAFMHLYEKKFWSYRDLAYLLGLSYKTIYFYINNKGYMSYKITKQIGEKLH
tara:strand:+ start:198 stop:590 length:393 start_codon:yes stop_codon:yes gene_type:complete